jgi:hypothetical protein
MGILRVISAAQAFLFLLGVATAHATCAYNFSAHGLRSSIEEKMRYVLRISKQPGDHFLGTGFLVDSERGLVFTAHHVLADNFVLDSEGKIREGVQLTGLARGLNAGKKIPLALKRALGSHDFAILTVADSSLRGMASSIDLSFWVPSRSESLDVLGYSYHDGQIRPLPGSLTRVVRKDENFDLGGFATKADYDIYETSHSLQTRYSGGPLFDPDGRAIAVVRAMNHTAINTTYFVPLRVLPLPIYSMFAE